MTSHIPPTVFPRTLVEGDTATILHPNGSYEQSAVISVERRFIHLGNGCKFRRKNGMECGFNRFGSKLVENKEKSNV